MMIYYVWVSEVDGLTGIADISSMICGTCLADNLCLISLFTLSTNSLEKLYNTNHDSSIILTHSLTHLWPRDILRKRITRSSPLYFWPTHRLSAMPTPSICSTAHNTLAHIYTYCVQYYTDLCYISQHFQISLQKDLMFHHYYIIHNNIGFMNVVWIVCDLRPNIRIPPVSELILQ